MILILNLNWIVILPYLSGYVEGFCPVHLCVDLSHIGFSMAEYKLSSLLSLVAGLCLNWWGCQDRMPGLRQALLIAPR